MASILSRPQWVNSLTPSDAMCHPTTRSTLAQVMATSKQRWLNLRCCTWHSLQKNCTENAPEGLLIFDMLNCFKDYQRCIHISYYTMEFVQQKKTKFTMQQPYILPILHWQYHACWCSGDFRSQGINRHGIDPQGRDIQFPASEELMKFRINAIVPRTNELTHGGLVMPCTTSKVQVITVSANLACWLISTKPLLVIWKCEPHNTQDTKNFNWQSRW